MYLTSELSYDKRFRLALVVFKIVRKECEFHWPQNMALASLAFGKHVLIEWKM